MPRRRLPEVNHAESHLELHVRFTLWAEGLGHVPTPEEIAARFGTSYSHSYRWRNAYCDAKGIERPAPRRDFTPAWPKGLRPARRSRRAGGNRSGTTDTRPEKSDL